MEKQAIEKQINDQIDDIEVGQCQMIETADDDVTVQISRNEENSYSLHIECVSPIDGTIHKDVGVILTRCDCFRAILSYLKEPAT